MLDKHPMILVVFVILAVVLCVPTIGAMNLSPQDQHIIGTQVAETSSTIWTFAPCIVGIAVFLFAMLGVMGSKTETGGSLNDDEEEEDVRGARAQAREDYIADYAEVPLGGGSYVVRAKGRYFVFTSHAGTWSVVETDRHNRPISGRVRADSIDRTGRSPKQALGEYVKEKVKTGGKF